LPGSKTAWVGSSTWSDDPEEIVAAYEDLTARLDSLDLEAGRDSVRDRFGPATIARRLAT